MEDPIILAIRTNVFRVLLRIARDLEDDRHISASEILIGLALGVEAEEVDNEETQFTDEEVQEILTVNVS